MTEHEFNDPAGTEVAVLGGGCFWCIEAVFQRLRGVHSVVSGYDLNDKMVIHRPRPRTFEELTMFHADGGVGSGIWGLFFRQHSSGAGKWGCWAVCGETALAAATAAAAACGRYGF